MRCPRCDDAPLADVNAGHPDLRDLSLAQCASCAGVWLERDALALLCPTLAGLDQQRLEIELTGKRGGGIGRCPACADVPYAFHVLEVEVDTCLRCGGIWLDGSEWNENPVDAGAPSDLEATRGPYRRSGKEAQGEKELRCALCAKRTEPSESFMSQWGLVCRVCHSARALKNAAQRAEESEAASSLLGQLRALFAR